jgi:hypothetical protein
MTFDEGQTRPLVRENPLIIARHLTVQSKTKRGSWLLMGLDTKPD